ncbi:MAG: nucleoside triphosphate pyrophosphatase [Rothia sp. (in: high G+C Gram-positive bacteria)]|nr:nucleoside triphosphate pyrophosphatase [Rothia sp. (in: high G+C Gram-positive bacteria)]
MASTPRPAQAAAYPRFVLASSSPARKKLLEDAGVEFEIIVSAVDEDAALAAAQEAAFEAGLGNISPAQTALLLAKAKALAVAQTPGAQGAYVLGCDSVFEFNGEAFGKPHTESKALERITALSGQSGQLHTGHWLVDCTAERHQQASELRTATVHFDTLSPQEVSAYVATGEPLWVAGSFTIDGLGAPFISKIEGEFHTVVGLSLNALRAMLAQMNRSITEFWKKRD